jgi:TfoX/Sxy family transcriptional regulator of competence genes
VKFGPAPPRLVSAFEAALPGPPVERRKMFGFPAAFINGNMFAGVFQDEIVVRLAERGREELMVEGGSLFEPMPGRPMREYIAAPPEIVADAAKLSLWVRRALAYARRLPPKGTGKRKAPARKVRVRSGASKPPTTGRESAPASRRSRRR